MRTNRIMFVFWACIASAFLMGALYLSSDLRRAELLGSGGRIEHGGKFGIHIGMSREVVTSRNSKLGYQESRFGCGSKSHKIKYKNQFDSAIAWHKPYTGVICTRFNGDELTILSWSIGGWEL